MHVLSWTTLTQSRFVICLYYCGNARDATDEAPRRITAVECSRIANVLPEAASTMFALRRWSVFGVGIGRRYHTKRGVPGELGYIHTPRPPAPCVWRNLPAQFRQPCRVTRVCGCVCMGVCASEMRTYCRHESPRRARMKKGWSAVCSLK